MLEVGTWSLPAKVHPEKKPQSKKNSTVSDTIVGNLIPYHLPSSFSTSGFFLQVHFCGQTAASEFAQGHSTAAT
jgi:hypothetical protein